MPRGNSSSVELTAMTHYGATIMVVP
jgi:hypothetical protein